jgi:hypothetical protein
MSNLIEKVENTSWFPVMTDGYMKCSCGRPLVKLEDGRYQCSYGYPSFDMSTGDIMIDKFGNIWLKKKEHDDKNSNRKDNINVDPKTNSK